MEEQVNDDNELANARVGNDQIFHLKKRRSAFKGIITRNMKKAQEIIEIMAVEPFCDA